MKPFTTEQLIAAIKAAAENAKLTVPNGASPVDYYKWLLDNASHLNPESPELTHALAYIKNPAQQPPASAHLDYKSLPIVFGMLAAAGKVDELNNLLAHINHRYGNYNLPFILSLKIACANEGLYSNNDIEYSAIV